MLLASFGYILLTTLLQGVLEYSRRISSCELAWSKLCCDVVNVDP